MAKILVALGKWLLRAGLALTVMVIGMGFDPAPCFQTLQDWTYHISVNSRDFVGEFEVSKLSGEYMLKSSIGGLGMMPAGLPWKQLLGSTGVVINEPVDMMVSHMQPIKALTTTASAMANPRGSSPDPEVYPDPGNQGNDPGPDIVIDDRYPPVAIYCTHSSETYLPDDDRAHSDSERGLINDVALELAKGLSQLSFRAVFVDTVHDSPEYTESYVKSRETVKQLLEEDSNWGVIIDVHRDSIPGQKTAAVVDVNGKKAAQMLIVVGSDQRKNNPEWEKNLEFAEKLYNEAENNYPGLVRGVRVKPGTYNQDLYSPAILLEVGNEYNSLEEAKYGITLFTEILARVLLEGN
ncbi:MAG: stage II sporulation protein P [Bacillota bacterium]